MKHHITDDTKCKTKLIIDKDVDYKSEDSELSDKDANNPDAGIIKAKKKAFEHYKLYGNLNDILFTLEDEEAKDLVKSWIREFFLKIQNEKKQNNSLQNEEQGKLFIT